MLRQGNIDDVIEILRQNQQNDFFNCVAITAKVRKGKSRLAKLISSRMYPDFTYENNYIGNPKHGETWRKLFNSPQKSTNWIDEAEKILSTERRYDKEQWWLQQLFNQFASHNKTVILCTPTFVGIDPRWRRAHITIWIYIYKRGKAILLKNRDIQSSLDVWGLDAMKEKELSTKADQMSDERIIQNFDANPCALFYFSFPDWDSPEEKAEYLTYKEASQADLSREFDKWEKMQTLLQNTTRAEIGIARVASYLNFRYQLPLSELGTLAGYSEDKMRQMTESFYQAIEDQLIDIESLPKKYYTPEFIEHVRLYLENKPKV